MLAFGERNAVDREWHESLTAYDVLLMPTWFGTITPIDQIK